MLIEIKTEVGKRSDGNKIYDEVRGETEIR